MKLQLAYRFSGEDRNKIVNELRGMVKVLEGNGHNVYCLILDKNAIGLSKASSIINAFLHVDSQDVLISWVKSSDKSEGQLLETGYALGRGKKLILLVQKKAETSLRSLADRVIQYDGYDDLLLKLNGKLK